MTAPRAKGAKGRLPKSPKLPKLVIEKAGPKSLPQIGADERGSKIGDRVIGKTKTENLATGESRIMGRSTDQFDPC
jgi:hypothetical protein